MGCVAAEEPVIWVFLVTEAIPAPAPPHPPLPSSALRPTSAARRHPPAFCRRLRPLLNHRRLFRLETPHSLLHPSPPAAVANAVPGPAPPLPPHGQQYTITQTATVMSAASTTYTTTISMTICRFLHRRRRSCLQIKWPVAEDHSVAAISSNIDGGGASWPGTSSSSGHCHRPEILCSLFCLVYLRDFDPTAKQVA
ncbi:PATATIN-like protein 8 [Striga asiatica]|uniref:PATATIN-like protein 8 n=1 Tax=Striga asiatica TaxID=4170 RepID=A0A5A7R7V2_STRAF|nr:PATATIN-like protein 8 [Striga asiatica]